MKKNSLLRVLGIMLILVMTLSLFAGCSSSDDKDDDDVVNEDPKSGDEDEVVDGGEEPAPEEEKEIVRITTPLVVGYSTFSEKFSPFFADTSYDQDAVDMTQVSLLITDRTGGVIYKGIEGEVVPYNGVDYTYKGISDLDVNYDEAADETVYKFTLRDDVKFSDGELLTADDVIFSLYALSDPSYDGSSTLYSLPIVGMQPYRTQVSTENLKKFIAVFDELYALGPDYEVTGSEGFTQEQADSVWAAIEVSWEEDLQEIVDYCVANYADYFESYVGGYTAEEIVGNEGLEIAAGVGLWGLGSTDAETKVLTIGGTEATFDLANGEYPTIQDFREGTLAAYGDFESYASVESLKDVSPFETVKENFIKEESDKSATGESAGVPNIEGIKKLSDTEVEITLTGFDATAIYKLGIRVSPLHYYGDEAQYDYDNNMFGFPYGDLSIVKTNTTQPMGAGPYRFVKYDNKIIYYEANENYYKGEPVNTFVQFKEGPDADKISGVGTGTIDITDPSFGNEAVEEIKGYNSNGEVTGETITTNTVDNLGYGYIGINANNVNVNGEPGSEASKNLRRAFATVISAYRELSIDSFYGERASVINYPISNTSWAAPQKSDEGYEIAFSVDTNGDALYTSDMVGEAMHEAAKEAAIDYLIAAGFTFDEAAGKFTAAPEGAKLSYEIIVPADGAGDHPSFNIAVNFKKVFDDLGFDINLNDPTDSNVLWDSLDAETQEIWCAAWGATIDPDMYQIYHSSNESKSNHYHIADDKLDQLMMDGRKSDDQDYRKAIYKEALDVIIDWAVEIPIYQRQNCIILSTERVNLDAVTPDITTFWGWDNDRETFEMN